ncbi:MAG: HNH endonuclease [Verrucomicrobiota bacterium]
MPRLSDQSGHAWAKIRQRILRRDRGLCQPCKRDGRLTLAQQVDHIVPVSKGGGDEDDNLQGICLACHDDKTRIDLGLKAVTACDANGVPLSPNHPWNK